MGTIGSMLYKRRALELLRAGNVLAARDMTGIGGKTLERLVASGLIAQIGKGPRRAGYRITEAGKTALVEMGRSDGPAQVLGLPASVDSTE